MKKKTWNSVLIFVAVVASVYLATQYFEFVGPQRVVAQTPAGCDPDGTLFLSVNPVHSETNVWCWSASAQMIMDFLASQSSRGLNVRNHSQCKQADDYYSNSNPPCCPNSIPTNCNDRGGWPRFGMYGFKSSPPDAGNEANNPYAKIKPHDGVMMDWQQLTQQLCKVGPFAYSWYALNPVDNPLNDPAGRLGHMVVATGYMTLPKTTLYFFTENIPMVQRIDPCFNEDCGGCCVDVRTVPYDEYHAGPYYADPISPTIHWVDYKDIAIALAEE